VFCLVQRLFDQYCCLQDHAGGQPLDPALRELKVADVNAKLDELAAAAGALVILSHKCSVGLYVTVS
jgi:hypothetical protein